MNLPNTKYAITGEILTATIAALEFAQARYEQEAVALLGAMLGIVRQEQMNEHVERMKRLGLERLDQAEKAAELVDFYLSL